MPTILAGNSTNVTTPLQASIVSSANNGSGKTRVLFSAPHLFGNDDWAFFARTSVIPTGLYQVTVIDATHVDLLSLAFTSAESTGTATDLVCTPAIQIPINGEPGVMDGILSALQGCLDRTQFLALLWQQQPSGWSAQFSADLTFDSGAYVTFDSGASLVLYNTADVASGGSWTWQSGASATWQSGSTATFATGSTLSVQGTFDVPAYNAITVSPADSRIIVQPLVPVIINSNCSIVLGLGSPGSAYLQVPGNSSAGGYGNTLALSELLDETTIAVGAISLSYNRSSGTHGSTAAAVYLVSMDDAGDVVTLGQVSLPTSGSGAGSVSLPDSVHGAVTISKAQYSYYLVIVGESSGSSVTFDFFPPQITFSNITYVGQR